MTIKLSINGLFSPFNFHWLNRFFEPGMMNGSTQNMTSLMGSFGNGSMVNGTNPASPCNWPYEEPIDFTADNTPTMWVEYIFYPILLFLCTVGNVLGIIVLSTDVAKTTTNVYLICLAVSDLCIV